MDERAVILQKLDLLRRLYYKDVYIPYDINLSTIDLKIEYDLAVHDVQKYCEEQEIKKLFNINSIIVLEILHCKIADITIKNRIRQLQQSHVWSFKRITECLYPLIDYCILRNRYDIEGYIGASLIYWFVTNELLEYKDIILESIKDEPLLFDTINDFK